MITHLVVAMLLQAPAATVTMPAPETSSMTAAEVKAFNATVDKDHPYYIRCRTVKVTGSLAKRGRVCRTLAEWTRTQEHGNNEARTIVEDSRAGLTGN